MKFRKPKLICIVDQDRICIGDIDAILHNIRRDQQIKFVMIEIMDNFLQLSWSHLPVRIPYRKPGNQISYHRSHLIDIFYPVMYKKGLASPGLLPKKSLCNELRGKTMKDRKSTRLNSSHVAISYAVFCLK